jgi:hypothetical protein
VSRLHLLIMLALTPAMKECSLLHTTSGGGGMLAKMLWPLVID